MRNKQRARPAIIHAAAFLLPVLGLFATYAVVGIRPFGDLSVLAIDLRNQYVSFFAYLRDELLLGGQSWLYTFAKALGGDMAGFSAYYLLSPFNLILLLFPTRHLATGVMVMTLCKVGCCGLAMSLLLNRQRARLASLLFSVPYALMDFTAAYQQNIMWLDGVILLPLIILGIERLLEGKSPWLYIVSLFIAIVTCYYIGFILCLFSLLYFLVSFFFFTPRGKGALKTGAAWRPAGSFALASLLSGGLSAAVLLPAVLSLSGGKATFTLENLLDKSFVSLAGVVSRYLPGTVNMSMIFFGYPHIYCGVLALICTALYLVNPKVERRRRWGAALLMGAILLSFCVGPLDRLWHGFNKPVGFLFRYSFIFSFLLLYFGWQGWQHLREGDVTRRLPAVVGAFAFAILLVWREEYTHLTTGKVLLGFGLALAFAVFLRLFALKKLQGAVLVLMALMLADLGASTFLALRRVEYFPYDYYHDFVRAYQPVVQAVKDGDDGFYRMENLDAFSDNDALLLGYFGLSHFSSSDKMFVRHFLDAAGYSEGNNSVIYGAGSTAGMDSLLGVKYLISRGGMAKPYEAASDYYGIVTWRNPGALPLGYMVSVGADHELAAQPGENLFEVQNGLWRALVPGLDEDLYRPATTTDIVTENMALSDFYGEDLYQRGDDEAEAYVEYTLTATGTDVLYLQLTTLNERGMEVYVNGEKREDDYLTGSRHGILALGRFEPGEAVSVQLVPKQSGEIFIMDAFFAYEDAALLEELTANLAAEPYEIERFTQSRFEGSVAAAGEKQWLLLTIPYDAGWHARLDGEPVPTRKALGALTAVEVPAGTHTLTLYYVPPGLYAGLGVSLASAAGIALWALLRRKRKAKKA